MFLLFHLFLYFWYAGATLHLAVFRIHIFLTYQKKKKKKRKMFYVWFKRRTFYFWESESYSLTRKYFTVVHIFHPNKHDKMCKEIFYFETNGA